jgi:hypothetical protein
MENLEEKVITLEKELLIAQQQIVKSENKAVMIKEKMTELEQFPEIAKMNAMLDYELKMARQFIASGAFPGKTPEQAYVIINAGKVLGLQPMQALGQLYVVNGNIGFWGAGLVAQLAKHGVKFTYENETANGVTVKATYKGETYSEIVKDSDQILTKSKAMTFAKKNKMRFHGVRMIANFYLAHLLNGISVWEPDDIEASKELQKGEEYFDLKEMIENCETLEQLDKIMKDHKKVLTSPKNIDLLSLYGQVRKEFELTESI